MERLRTNGWGSDPMLDRLDDTIVAISSPPGRNARGVVRLSGPDAFALAGQLFESAGHERFADMPGHHRLRGRVRIDKDAFVPAEAYTFRAPASYTRQDVVELQLPGSPVILAMVLDLLTVEGARPAEPGEFTARAYFNGAMDLTRVEGVAAMIHARNDTQLRASEALLHGQLSKQTAVFREQLADLLARVEAEIDFAEEPIEFIARAELRGTIDAILDPLTRLCREAPSVERLEVLPSVLLVGPPNAGKSTLFNRLTGMDRAIRSATAGTTRDVISAPVQLADGEILLQDSAGLLDAALPQTNPASHPETLAQQATRKALTLADGIVFVADATEPLESRSLALYDEVRHRPLRIVANKTDLTAKPERLDRSASLGDHPPIIPISALTGQGIDDVRVAINEMIFADVQTPGAELLALSNRQRQALNDAREALQRARELATTSRASDEPTELLALEIREAMNALSLLLGEVATEELLGRVFSRFCVGK